MNTVFLFLNNCLNQPLTEGHFVVIDSNCQDLLWCQSKDTGKFQIFDDAFPIHYPLLFVVSRIKGQFGIMGRTQVDFFLPMKEFLPHSVNSHMSINSGPCAAVNEVIKTPFIGCVKDSDIIDMAFVFMPSFLENGRHAVVLGMINVSICQYGY